MVTSKPAEEFELDNYDELDVDASEENLEPDYDAEEVDND